MKKQSLLSLLFSFIAFFSYSQSIPHGMNYQAVARDKSGQVLSEKIITIRITLRNETTSNSFYSEIHRVTTNESGMFSLIIGRGSVLNGNFNSIPWSTENIWMELAMKSANDNQFNTVYSTEMMAVPFAFHAGTASSISGSSIPYYLPGGNVVNGPNPVPATSWQLTGNSNTNPPTDYLGTSDLKDFYIKTNAIERMRILSTGNISITTSLNVGIDLTVGRDATINRNLFGKDDMVIDSDLTVKKNAFFNTYLGTTVNYGPFTVDKTRPSVMTGSLRVDQLTNLNDSLSVNNAAPTLFTGTLRVDQATNLYNAFNVNSQSPSVMTGRLRVDSNVTLNNHLRVDNPNYNSQDSVSGAVVVLGGVGIGKNLNIGGDARISGQTELNGQVRITDGRPAENPDSGALVVSGGVGIGKQLMVGGYAHLYDSTNIDGKTLIRNSLTVKDSVDIQNKLRVTNTTGVYGTSEITGQVTVNAPSFANGNQLDRNEYPMQLDGGWQGIAIKVNSDKSKANNFMSFWDQSGNMQGRIEGLAAGEYLSTEEYTVLHNRYADAVVLADLNVANATLMAASEAANLVAAIASHTVCIGLGLCDATPPPSLIYVASLNFAAAAGFVTVAVISRDEAITQRNDFENNAPNRNGVTYESGAGDYAEYLEMLNEREKMFPGDIVGVKGGKITRNTEDADKIMAISTQPIILGNMPKDGNENKYRRVAFLGQIPVRVMGEVNAGDYILPDGNNSGMGKAVSAENLQAEDIRNILGIAWSASEAGSKISTINVAVGLNVIDNQKEIEALQNELAELNNQLASSDKEIALLVPGYNPEAGTPVFTPAVIEPKNAEFLQTPTSEQITYYKPNRRELERAMNGAILKLEEIVKTPAQRAYVLKLKSDPKFRSAAVDNLSAKIDKLINDSKQLDKQLSK